MVVNFAKVLVNSDQVSTRLHNATSQKIVVFMYVMGHKNLGHINFVQWYMLFSV
jgi:hypothetical protein